ncbi:MAG: ankyrin repeat domain-containing protein [Sulfurimonas sp.]|jgi:hypothetical protein
MKEENNFNHYKSLILLSSVVLLFWYFFNIDLSQVSFFKGLALENQKVLSYLAFMLVGLQLYFLIEMILEYKKINEKSIQLKIQYIFTILFLLLAIVISYPKLIENTSIKLTTRIDLAIPIISGFFIMLSLSYMRDFLETVFTFYKFRKRLMFSMLIELVILSIVFSLIIVFFLEYSSRLIYYNLTLLVIGMLITYIFFIRKKKLYSEKNIIELDKVNKYLDRQVEVSECIKNGEHDVYLTSIKNGKKQHKNIMKYIQANQESTMDDLSFRYKFHEEINLLNVDGKLQLETANKKNKFVTTEVYNKKTDEVIEQLDISFEYLEEASKKMSFPNNKEDYNNIITVLVSSAYELCKINDYDKNELLMQFASDGSFDELKDLLNQDDVNIDYVAPNSWTPLLIATANGHYKAVQLLLDKAAEPNLTNAYGASALHFASKYGKKSLCRLLLKYNADINLADMKGETALMKAVQENFFNIVELLIENNADVSLIDHSNMSALNYAKKNKNGKILRILKKNLK